MWWNIQVKAVVKRKEEDWKVLGARDEAARGVFGSLQRGKEKG